MIKKTLASALAAMMGLSMASGSAQAFSDSELVIWVGGDKAHKGVQAVGKQFEKDTGIKVTVAIPENLTDRFQQSASVGEGPDIVMWAHDRYGEWAQSGLLAEINPSESFRNSINDLGWQATSSNGKIYGYPIAMEAISLIYNKKLIKKAPATFEEMFELDKGFKKEGVATILWDQGNPYFSAPMIFSNGGYSFKETPTGYDIKDVGVNNPGAKQGADLFLKLIEKDVLPRGTDYAVTESKFNKGQAAMMISGPWAWSNLDRSGINYGVAPLPTINGSPARAFVGVWGAAINRASPNKELTTEFLEHYLLTEKGLETMNKDVSLGAVANKAYLKKLSADERIASTYQNATNGLLMPNVPQMGKFWASMESALKNIAFGREKVDVALDNAAQQIVN